MVIEKKDKKPEALPREAVEEALLQIEAALLALPWENEEDQARVEECLHRIRHIPTELELTKEQKKLAKRYGIERIWWVDTAQSESRTEETLQKQVEFIYHYHRLNTTITHTLEEMRKTHGGALVVKPGTVTEWKRRYPDFYRAMVFSLVYSYERTIQALKLGVQLGKPALVIFDLINKGIQMDNMLKGEKIDEESREMLESLPRYQHVQTMKHEGGEDFGKNTRVRPVDLVEILKKHGVKAKEAQEIQDDVDDAQFGGES